MRYVSAYLLASMATVKGHHEHHVTAAEIENILGSVGVDCDKKMAQAVVDRLSGKSLDELIALGAANLCAAGAPGAAAPSAAASASAAAPAPAAEAAKPAEAKKEEKEESDEDMGFGLFD